MTAPINIYPRATEKAYGQAKNNVYVFDAPVSANKKQIIAAVEAQFDVKTVSIKTLIQTGKAVRASKGKRSQPGIAHRKDLKKAYVTLVKGDTIKVFDESTEEEPKAKAVKKEKK
ncbi:MAG: 50S ribosomal protein L23 [Candidatus Saccharibacteria bacterium]